MKVRKNGKTRKKKKKKEIKSLALRGFTGTRGVFPGTLSSVALPAALNS